MTLYRIKDWSTRFENNRTRELKKLDWVPTPNKHDGDGYTMLLSLKNGEAMFGAWNAVLQVASRCEIRGTLLRAGGAAHDPTSLARVTRFSVPTIEAMLNHCASSDIGWIEVVENQQACQPPATIPQPVATIPHEGITEGKGREGNERREGKEAVVTAEPPKASFQKPTVKQVELECAKIGLPTAEAEKFWSFYESKGWKVGAQAMKSWEHAMVTWRGRFVERGGVLQTSAKAAVTNLDYCKIGNRSWHYTSPPTREQFQDDSSFEAYSTHFQNWLNNRKP